MLPRREPVRTPSFDAAAVPTAFLVFFAVMSIVAGWTLPDAAVVPLGAGMLLGLGYSVFAYFTTALAYLPTPKRWLRTARGVVVVGLFLWAGDVTPLPDWSILTFVVGLLIALAASRWWLLFRQNGSQQNCDQSRPH